MPDDDVIGFAEDNDPNDDDRVYVGIDISGTPLDRHSRKDDFLGRKTFKDSVRIATEANDSLSGLAARDGITPVANDRVLVKAQTAGEDNGIYLAQSGAWTRARDFDTSPKATSGAFMVVQEGTVNADKLFQLTTNEPITLDTTSLTFAEFSGGGEVFAWTADHDTNGNTLVFSSDDSTAPGGAIMKIYSNTSNLTLNVGTGQLIEFTVNNLVEYQATAAAFILGENMLQFTSSNTTINDVSANLEYDVATTNSHKFRVNDVVNFEVLDDLVRMGTTGTNPKFDFERGTASGDIYTIGELRFRHPDAGAVIENYARIIGVMETDASAGNEEGSLQFFVTENGVHDVLKMSINDAGLNVINMFAPVDIDDNDLTGVANIDADSDIIHSIDIGRNVNLANGTAMGNWNMKAQNFAGAYVDFVRMEGRMENDGDGIESGAMSFSVMRAGALEAKMLINVIAGRMSFFPGDNEVMRLLDGGISMIAGKRLALDNLDSFSSTQRLTGTGTEMRFDIATGDSYEYRINNVIEMTLNGTDLDLLGKNVNNLSNLEFQTSTGVPAAGVIAIYNDGGGITNNVGSALRFEWSIQDVDVMTLTATTLSLEDNNISNIGSATTGDVISPNWTFVRDTPQADGYSIGGVRFRHDDQGGSVVNYAFIEGVMEQDGVAANEEGSLKFSVTNSGNHSFLAFALNNAGSNTAELFYPLDMNSNNITELPGTFVSALSTVTAISGDFVLISDTSDSGNLKKVDALDFLAAAGEVFTWTADHATGGNALTLTDDASPPGGSVASMYLAAGDLNWNVPTGGEINLRINDISQLTLSGTAFAFPDGLTLQWAGSGNRRLLNNGSGFLLEVVTGDTFRYQIQNVTQWTLEEGRVFTGDVATQSYDFERITAQADDYIIGETRWRHNDAVAVLQNYARIIGVMESDVDPEDGSLQFFVTEAGVHDVLFMTLNDASAGLIQLLKSTNVTGTFTADTYVGQSSIVTVGTLTAGTIDLGNITVTGSVAEFNAALQADTFFYISNNISNMATSTSAQFDAANSDGSFFLNADNISAMAVSTVAQFNAALTGETFAFIGVANAWGTSNQNIASTGEWQEGGVAISPIGIHDIPINASGMYATTNTPATGLTNTNFGTNDIDLKTWDFTSTAADETVQFRTPFPRNYNNGAITVSFSWSQSSGTGNVVWRIGSVAVGNAEAIDAAFVFSADVVDAAGTANQTQQFTTASFTPGGTPADANELAFEVMRQGTDALDTFTGTARLHSIVIHITTDAATAA